MTRTAFNHWLTIGNKEYEIIESSDVIEADSKKGTKYWQGHVVRDVEDNYYTCSSSWATTQNDGLSKKNWSTPYYAEPKNTGKANETTSRQQAFAEFESDVKKQKRIRNSDKPLPMLAQTWQKRKHKVKYPVMVQPKLDGVRMLTDGIDTWSRKNKPYLPEIVAHILPLDPNGDILDGELMLPWKDAVNVVNSATKKYNENTPHLVYYVYDLIPTQDEEGKDLPFKQRIALVERIVKKNAKVSVQIVETHWAQNEEEVDKLHEYFIEQGFEGSIVRDAHEVYHIDKRVDAVLKRKDFVDEEFEIMDIIPAGGGSSANVGKFVCRANNGVLFESTSTGKEEYRREILKNKHKYIGKFAKVKYRELTKAEGVPFHSNVLEIRETKDKGY